MSATRSTLHQLVRHFRILRGWDIRWARRAYRGQVTIHPKRNSAAVHPWGAASNEPDDFRVHEVLHCAMRALLRMDRRKVKELRQAEEELVQDICAMLCAPPVKGRAQNKQRGSPSPQRLG